MTEEEFESLKAEKEALLNKNKELLSELKTARNKNKEIDSDAYYKALDELDSLKSENSKLSNELNKKAKDFDGLSKALEEKDNYLKNLTLENALNEHLGKLNLRPSAIRGQKALLKAEAQITDDGVLIGGKPIGDYLSEWINTDEGKDSVLAPANSGTNATGSNSSATPIVGKLNGTKAEQEAYIASKFNL